MEILEIIPFYKAFKKDTLSYFSSKKVPAGSIVTITIRNKDVKGLVISKREARSEKQEVKDKQFALKKIKAVAKNTVLGTEVISAANKTSEYFATSTGAILSSVLPKFVLDNLDKVKKITNEKPKNKSVDELTEKYVIQESETERYSSYKRLIREEFAKKKSVLFICPTRQDAEYANQKISKGISDNTYIFHSGFTNNQLLKKWNEAITNKKQVLIITTPTYMAIPRNDIGSIVIERESSRSYRSMKAPYLDYRIFAENYAKEKNIRFFLGDLVLRLETLNRIDEQEFHEFTPLKYRTLSTAKIEMIDMKEETPSDGEKFFVLSDKMKEMIRNAHEESENTFLFTSRRGLSPTIVCMDCGTIVSCKNCDAPMVLHGKDPTEKHNFFLCHRCNEQRQAGELCKKCGGWRLKTLGIGSQLIEKEVKKEFPEIKTAILDSDHTRTPKQAEITAEKFNSQPGTLLIGTEMALLYLRDEIDNVGVVSVDSMFSNPDFNIKEKILNTLSNVKQKATKNFLIQTRKAEEEIFRHITYGNLAEFIRLELDDRQKYDYPPYSILIKIIIKGTDKGVERELEILREFLKEYELIEYPIIRESTKTKITKGVLIRFSRKDWPNKDLAEKLRLLPAYYKIVVNAENIF